MGIDISQYRPEYDQQKDSLAELTIKATIHAALDGLESMVLALQGQGFDIEDPRIQAAISETLDAIENNLS